MPETLVVVGGGQAASSLVAGLRAAGDSRPVVLVSEEPDPPYRRPPLSKGYLAGGTPAERLAIRPERWYAENGVALRLGQRVEAIDRAARTVRLAGGEALGYARLALATGASPRRLPDSIGGGLAGVHVLRSRADADALGGELAPGRRIAIVGGGYIGLEAAASAAARGARVAVVEMAERILQRVAAAETSAWFRELHAGHGVAIRESTGLRRIAGEGGRAVAVELDDGETLAADAVVVGVGVRPNDGLAAAAGLAADDGILVDEFCRTSDPAIVAAGDCARFPWRGGRVRLESVQNAQDQGAAAARTLAGAPEAYRPIPWFWSDQYDAKLQIAGLNTGYDATATRPGRRDGALSVWYYRGDALLAVDSMNDAASHAAARRLLARGTSPPRAHVADPALDLKTLAPRER